MFLCVTSMPDMCRGSKGPKKDFRSSRPRVKGRLMLVLETEP